MFYLNESTYVHHVHPAAYFSAHLFQPARLALSLSALQHHPATFIFATTALVTTLCAYSDRQCPSCCTRDVCAKLFVDRNPVDDG